MSIMLFEFQYNYKIPTSGEYISDRRHTNPDLCVGVGEWGLTLIGALFSSDFSHMCMGLSFAV